MALPKALLCVLGETANGNVPEEALLRASGFATATLHWGEVANLQRGWTQLLPILDDQAVQAWVFAGHPADFTDEVLSRISMLTLAMTRPAPPVTACVLTGSGEEPAFPELLGHIKVFYGNTSFAAKLAAARMKPASLPQRPFHLAAHVDPLIGQWLEIGPPEGEIWPDFMAGVVDAEVTAFGVGSRGAVPLKSTLHYPQNGIKGQWGEYAFSACAAKDALGAENACYMRVEGCPRIVFITKYPEDKTSEEHRQLRHLDLF
jgi:hypothetical protein